VLGKEWTGSDIDIFCTQDAAAHVRGRLSSDARLGLSGFKLGRYSQDQQVRSLESNIEHVEEWATTPEDSSPEWDEPIRGRKPEVGGLEQSLADGQHMLNTKGHSYTIGSTGPQAPQDDESPVGQLPAFSFDLSIEPADCPLRCVRAAHPPGCLLRLCSGCLTFSCCLMRRYIRDHHDFPDVADLVVGKAGSTDARDLLSAFDIGLCKAYYDGTTLHVHDPHLSFGGRSMVHEPRAAVIQDYLACLESHPCGNTQRHRNGWGHKCTYAGPSDVCEAVSLAQWTAAAIVSPDSVPEDRRRRFGSKEYHNFLCRMVDRLKKYAGRGIEFVNCPEGALEAEICMDEEYGEYG
jgi:hypothetical protein